MAVRRGQIPSRPSSPFPHRMELRESRTLGRDESSVPRGDSDSETTLDRKLVCALCRAVVTSKAERIAVGDAHEHTRANLGSWVHRFGCFARAPGCSAIGEPSVENAWFPGAAWQIALCTACGDHLGWRFSGSDGVFWGLLVAKLVEG